MNHDKNKSIKNSSSICKSASAYERPGSLKSSSICKISFSI
uniref:Uncharacterized protein n=1 Tax=Anguilla anguilla TaxID=7936 RepID=A0A0E9UYF7_ANGAN